MGLSPAQMVVVLGCYVLGVICYTAVDSWDIRVHVPPLALANQLDLQLYLSRLLSLNFKWGQE